MKELEWWRFWKNFRWFFTKRQSLLESEPVWYKIFVCSCFWDIFRESFFHYMVEDTASQVYALKGWCTQQRANSCMVGGYLWVCDKLQKRRPFLYLHVVCCVKQRRRVLFIIYIIYYFCMHCPSTSSPTKIWVRFMHICSGLALA